MTNAASALGAVVPMQDPDQVIEVLPAALNDADLKQWHQRLALDPSDMDALNGIANSYLDLAAQTGDERYLGYLTQLLQARPDDKSVATTVLRARLLQRQHQFDAARTQLESAIEKDPRNTQAHLLMAYILMAQGDPQRAQRHCSALFSQAPSVSVHCLARAQALNGHAANATERLLRLHDIAVDPQERQEIQLTLAEIAERTGSAKQAEQRFQEILKIDPRHALARLHLADLYLHHQRYRDCWNLPEQDDLQPSLLLRKAIAAKMLALDDASPLQQRLQRYFDLEVLRNANYASRDYAIFLRVLAQQNDAALHIALDNWKTQREPEDAIAVLQAESGTASEADTAISLWLEQTGLEDIRIQKSKLSHLQTGLLQ